MEQERKHIVDILFVLTVFTLFALSALVLVVIGANVYQNTVNDMTANYEARTAISYVSEKVRQNDAAGAVTIGELDGVSALVLTSEYYGVAYDTYLYCYDGSLMELLVRQGSNVGQSPLSAGQAIMKLKDLTFEIRDDCLLVIDIETSEGHREMICTALRSLR